MLNQNIDLKVEHIFCLNNQRRSIMYKIKNISSDYLLDNGFKELNNGMFLLRFPIYFYKKIPVIFCNVALDPKIGKRLTIDVVNSNGMIYSILYNTECDHLSPKFRNELNDNIEKKINDINNKLN